MSGCRSRADTGASGSWMEANSLALEGPSGQGPGLGGQAGRSGRQKPGHAPLRPRTVPSWGRCQRRRYGLRCCWRRHVGQGSASMDCPALVVKFDRPATTESVAVRCCWSASLSWPGISVEGLPQPILTGQTRRSLTTSDADRLPDSRGSHFDAAARVESALAVRSSPANRNLTGFRTHRLELYGTVSN